MNTKLAKEIRDQSCVVCGRLPSDAAHVHSQKAGGKYERFNLIPLCRIHHVEQHSIGWGTFWKKYESVSAHLIQKGWELTDCVGILRPRHPEMWPL